jgi:hypothetical protein
MAGYPLRKPAFSGKYPIAHACEMAWKENNRRMAKGSHHETVADMALAHPVSRVRSGYWQRNTSEH